METQIIKIKRLNNEAILPHRAYENDAMYDIHVLVNQDNKPFYFDENGNKIELQVFTDNVTLLPNQRFVFKTGLSLTPPHGYFTKLHVRSSVGIKLGLQLANCTAVIDENYLGELLVCLENKGEHPVTINDKDRMCQLELVQRIPSQIMEVDELGNTERGTGGIGSSGNK